jgi:zinc transporter 7
MAQSLISTLFISIIPIFLIYFMSVIFMSNGTMNETFTQILLSFACGGLLGDVFFHTLPHLSEGHSHDHGHGHSHEHGHDHGHDHGHAGGHAHSVEDMLTNLIIVLGIMVFFMLEQVTQRYFSGGEGHGHSHGHVEEKDKKKGKKQDTKEEEAAKAKAIRYNSFAILSMTGDFIHNFTDGLSIGVSYVADFKMGLATTAAMFFHEIPHEVGDFAILFQNKYTLLQIVGV